MTATKEEHARMLGLTLEQVTEEWEAQDRKVQVEQGRIKAIEEKFDALIKQLRKNQETELAPFRKSLEETQSRWFTLYFYARVAPPGTPNRAPKDLDQLPSEVQA